MPGDNTDLGDRMKRYERVTQLELPRRTYTIIRIDGRAFHNYTRNARKPFEAEMMYGFYKVTEALIWAMGGSVFGYTQSDEISLLLWDARSIETEPWFGGNIQKLASLAASLTTGFWLQHYHGPCRRDAFFTSFASFDARVFTIPDRTEVANYFLWRQRDAIRNSRMALARVYYSAKELEGISSQAAVDNVLTQHGADWNMLHPQFRYGKLVNPSRPAPITEQLDWAGWASHVPTYPTD